jgi:hypothetical protein
MTTRAEAIARARANIQPGIDASLAQVATLDALVSERIQAVYESTAVVNARDSWIAGLDVAETRKQLLDQRIADGFAAPAVQTPLANQAAAKQTLTQREANLAARLAVINAYYDELERRAATAPIVDQPPVEAA